MSVKATMNMLKGGVDLYSGETDKKFKLCNSLVLLKDSIKQITTTSKFKSCSKQSDILEYRVLPFIASLGYNIQDKSEVMTNFIAKIGVSDDEHIDVAIFFNGVEYILIKVLNISSATSMYIGDNYEDALGTLYRNFVASKAKYGIVTDGITYHFYSDNAVKNKLDKNFFLSFSVEDYNKSRELDKLFIFMKSSPSLAIGDLANQVQKYKSSMILCDEAYSMKVTELSDKGKIIDSYIKEKNNLETELEDCKSELSNYKIKTSNAINSKEQLLREKNKELEDCKSELSNYKIKICNVINSKEQLLREKNKELEDLLKFDCTSIGTVLFLASIFSLFIGILILLDSANSKSSHHPVWFILSCIIMLISRVVKKEFSTSTALVLCFLDFGCGLHKFYTGKFLSGFTYLLIQSVAIGGNAGTSEVLILLLLSLTLVDIVRLLKSKYMICKIGTSNTGTLDKLTDRG